MTTEIPDGQTSLQTSGKIGVDMRDLDIRRELRREMALLQADDPDTLVVEELGLCQGVARVDMAVINGSLHGYEIKSDQDTLYRLPAQSATYNRVLDFVTIVTSRSHAIRIRQLIPKWWGISVATPQGANILLKVVRQACRNTSTDPFASAQLLWRDEALSILEERGLAEGLRSKPRGKLWTRLASSIPFEELRGIVRDTLKRRITSQRELSQPL